EAEEPECAREQREGGGFGGVDRGRECKCYRDGAVAGAVAVGSGQEQAIQRGKAEQRADEVGAAAAAGEGIIPSTTAAAGIAAAARDAAAPRVRGVGAAAGREAGAPAAAADDERCGRVDIDEGAAAAAAAAAQTFRAHAPNHDLEQGSRCQVDLSALGRAGTAG